MSNSKKCYKFEDFLEIGRRLTAIYKAQYKGVYYMKGGGGGGWLGEAANFATGGLLNDFTGGELTTPIADIGAILLGQPELIPLINAGITTGTDLLQGQSIGKSLGQGAISGGEAFAGQEVLGAAAQAFPETAGSLGVGAGGNSLTDLLGSTTGAGSLTGSGTIGGDISNLFSGTGAGGVPSSTATTPSSATNPTAQPSNVPASTQSAGVFGGGAAGGASAPAGFTPDSGDVTNQFAQGLGGQPSLTTGTQLGSLVNNTGSLQDVGTSASSTNLPGTSGVGESGTFNVSNPSGTPSLSDFGTNAPPNFSGGQNTGLLSPVTNVFAGSPSADTLAANNETFGNLPNVGGSGSLNSAANAAGGTVDANGNLVAGGNPSAASSGLGGAKPPNSIGQLFQPGGFTGSNVLSALGNNIGPLAAAGGIGLDALRGEHQTAADKAIAGQASALGGQGQQLENYLQTGTLPAGEQAGVTQALDSAIASIKSRYASMGMSGSSAEQQDIAAAQGQAQAAAAQMQEQLLSTGISETGMSSQLYSELLKNSMANDTNLSGAIANFASAAAGGGNFGKGGQTITIGGNS